MTTRTQELQTEIARLHRELAQEIAKERQQAPFEVDGHRARFTPQARQEQKVQRMGLRTAIARTEPRLLLTGPLIFSLVLPFLLLDLWVTLYHEICFRAYRIPRVVRRDFIRIDRHHLAYLTWFQKIYCVYCGYINGLIAYVREIAARTEAFWCPIKHAGPVARPHDRYAGFLDYGDGEDYLEKLDASREEVRRAAPDDPDGKV